MGKTFWVLQIVDLTGFLFPGSDRFAAAGEFVETFDPDYAGGMGKFTSTPDLAQAMRFPDAGAALKCWQTQSTVRPLRDDGRPNRPLTALTVSPRQVEEVLELAEAPPKGWGATS